MRTFLQFFLLFHGIFCYEYYCKKGSTGVKWEEVEKSFNDPEGGMTYKFDSSLSHSVLDQKCTANNILVLRKLTVEIDDAGTITLTKSIVVIEGDKMNEVDLK
ncbi:hypothetical protein PFISCL1PPCAC_19536, partial [Pristionchus fissidentatus]